MKEYLVDKEKFRELIKKQIKRHPSYKIIRKFKMLCIVIAVLAPIMFASYILTNDGFDFLKVDNYGRVNEFTQLESFGMVIALSGSMLIFYIFLIRAAQLKCEDQIIFKMNETLILTEGGMENSYKPCGEGIDTTYDVIKTKYKDIERLVYNTHHERLRIYALSRDSRYEGFPDRKRQYTIAEKGTQVFYMYYENSEELLKELSERSKVQIEYCDKPEVVENL